MSRCWRKIGRSVAIRTGILAGGLIAGIALAEAKDGPADTDWQLTLRARNALWDEAPFDKLNLGVSIRDGVAYLSGPVPSMAVGDQAVARLRSVRGIRGVKDETFVPPADEPLFQSMPHPVTAQRPSVSVAPAVLSPPPAVVAVAPAPPPQPTVSLSPPIAVPVKRMSLAEQIEALRLGDRRFADVRVEVTGDTVVMRGSVPKSADAWEFVAAVRQLPGVNRVVQNTTTQAR